LALVTVLWVLVLLSLIAASFTATTRTEVNLTRNLVENAQAEALAEAGLTRALLGLLAGRRAIDFGDEVAKLPIERPGLRGALEAEPADPEGGEFPPGSLAPGEAGEPWRADGTVYAWHFGGGALRAAVESEAGKIDLNAADEALLRGLFLSARWTGPDGAPQGLDEAEADALVDAVRDFADPDDLTRLNGAEDRDYLAAGLPWGAKDAAFEAVEELQQVLGMTAPLYQAVAPALTVYTGAKGVDARLAPRQVLLALSAASGGSAGTETEAQAVDDYLAARAEAPADAAPAFPAARGQRARARARVYTIHAEARVPSGAVFAREAVVRLGGGAQAARIEAWRQGERRLFPLPEVR
jgi:general secretion pathway protein K